MLYLFHHLEEKKKKKNSHLLLRSTPFVSDLSNYTPYFISSKKNSLLYHHPQTFRGWVSYSKFPL